MGGETVKTERACGAWTFRTGRGIPPGGLSSCPARPPGHSRPGAV